MSRIIWKHISVFLLAVVILCAVAGCGETDQNEEPVEGPAVSEDVQSTPEAEPSPEVSTTPEPEPLPEVSEEPVVPEEPEPEVELKEGETLTATGHILTQVNGATYVDGVLIVNKTYSIPEDYPQKAMTDEARAAVDAMIQAAAAEGLTLKGLTDYRSYSFQTILYNNYVARDGQAEADRYSARPGHSEHHTGLAIDLNSLETSFGETPEGIWLANHCVEYGFIIRYPQGKEHITGYMYEPWHVRYVGVELAQKLYLGDGEFTTMEEYFGITSSYADASESE